MGDSLNIYIDEYGNLPLSTEKEGTSKYFVLVAVAIKQEQVDSIRSRINELQEELFSGAPIESKRVRNDHAKRTAVLSALCEIPDWKYHVLIVDKTKLERNGGLEYKRSFYKYFNRKLYEHLVNNSISTSFVADEHGTTEFMNGLRSYLNARLSEGMLFSLRGMPQIDFSNSETESVLCLPDYIAGTWGKVLESDATEQYKSAWRVKLTDSSRLIRVQSWPQNIGEGFFQPEISGKYDSEIRKLSLLKAYGFIELNSENYDENVRMQVDVLEYLLYRQMYDDNSDYVYGEALVDHLKSLGYENITSDTLRYDVIAPLRNEGLFISSSRRGYKVSLTEKDVVEFFDYSQRYILPILGRVRKVSESIGTSSNGEIDLLASFPKLKRIADNMTDYEGL